MRMCEPSCRTTANPSRRKALTISAPEDRAGASRGRQNGIGDEVQAHSSRTLRLVEIAADSLGDHFLQLFQIGTLRDDAPLSGRVVPRRDEDVRVFIFLDCDRDLLSHRVLIVRLRPSLSNGVVGPAATTRTRTLAAR